VSAATPCFGFAASGSAQPQRESAQSAPSHPDDGYGRSVRPATTEYMRDLLVRSIEARALQETLAEVVRAMLAQLRATERRD